MKVSLAVWGQSEACCVDSGSYARAGGQSATLHWLSWANAGTFLGGEQEGGQMGQEESDPMSGVVWGGGWRLDVAFRCKCRSKQAHQGG